MNTSSGVTRQIRGKTWIDGWRKKHSGFLNTRWGVAYLPEKKNNDSIHNRDLPDLLNNPGDSQTT